MSLLQIIRQNSVFTHIKATTKKQLLQELAQKAAQVTGFPERSIFDVLFERERLSTTGIGQGVAIPHGRLADISQVHGFFARLDRPVDFEAIDEKPIDLVFMLLAPANAGADHLRALAKASRLLRDQKLCEKIRGCTSADAIYALVTQEEELEVSAA